MGLYVLAVAVAIYGIIRVSLDFSGASLGYLAGLVGIFMAVGAGIQQVEKQREERRLTRLQSEQDSTRRFDERFSAVTQGLASSDSGIHPGAGAVLMSFLRESNSAFHQQTYHYLLANLKSSSSREQGHDHTFVRAFECAAHLVLPSLASFDRVPSTTGRHNISRSKHRAKGLAGKHNNIRINQRRRKETAAQFSKSTIRFAPKPTRAEDWQAPHERHLAVDFSGARLDGIDLSNLELSDAELSETFLCQADLSGSCLWRAHGSKIDMTRASLRHANLEEVVFLQLTARGADFSHANLVAARFAPRHQMFDRENPQGQARAVLSTAQFVRARLQGACLNGADLRDARFDGANLKGTYFYAAQFNTATLLTILRSVSQSWQKAYWDPNVRRELNRLANTKAGSKSEAEAARLCKTFDAPAMYYRQHPYPHHPNPPRRILWMA